MDWLSIEVLNGFQRLITLGLNRQPAREVLPMTVQVWVESLSERLAWDKMRDTPRVRAAFSTLVRTREEWPKPKNLLDAMPPAAVHKALPTAPADQARADAAIEEIQSILRAPVKNRARVPPSNT